jgi:membrane protease YdiL (CAAX protease family)
MDWLILLSGNAVASRSLTFTLSCASPAMDTVALSGLALPVVEEIAHRGILLAGLAPFGIVTAVLGSSLVFAILHTSFIAPFVFGMLAASLALRSGALWIPVIAHSTFNLMNALEAACLHVTATGDGRIDPVYAVVAATAIVIMLAILTVAAGTGTPGRTGTGTTGH